MTRDDVSAIVNRQIAGDWNRTNPHGVNLRRCLVTPERKRYIDPMHEERIYDLWLVLEEDPETRTGYKIVFDESTGDFGLAIIDDKERDIFLGLYGTFIEALDSM